MILHIRTGPDDFNTIAVIYLNTLSGIADIKTTIRKACEDT